MVKNVFDFDAFSKSAEETLTEVLGKHGIPIGINRGTLAVNLAYRHPLPEIKEVGSWGISDKEEMMELSVDSAKITLDGPYQYNPATFHLDRFDMRTQTFSEQTASWQLPLHEVNMVSDVVSNGESE